MVFEMPEEISGQKNRNVLCQGRVIRSKDQMEPDKKAKHEKDEDSEPTPGLLAATIVDYKFIH
jgi:hypothetical protein